MREAVIVASSRTGLAKSFRGSFNMTRPEDLAAHCIADVLKKTPQLEAHEIEDVILGCAQPHGMQGLNVGRRAAVLAGLPVSVAGATVNRFCSSGLQAIAMAAHEIIQEGADAAIGGGVESISLVQRDVNPHPALLEKAPGSLHGNGSDGGGGGETLQDRQAGAGRIRASKPAADCARAARRIFFHGDRAHEGHHGAPGQKDR